MSEVREPDAARAVARVQAHRHTARDRGNPQTTDPRKDPHQRPQPHRPSPPGSPATKQLEPRKY